MARSHFISVSRQPATSRWPTLSTKACLFIITVLLAANGAGVTLAEDWPGWRKDGSGVSNETGIPQSWDPEHNIVWKTLVPGEGISSPIAWRDRIFITSVEPGTIRHVAYHSYRALLCLLTLAALWWYVEGTPADPLGPRRSAERLAPTVGTIAGKAMRVTLFVGVAYAVLVACEQLRDCYP